VPLHADAEARPRRLEGFDDTVRRCGHDREAWRQAIDGLMMTAVHLQASARSQTVGHGRRQT